jgi:hypothetical protein
MDARRFVFDVGDRVTGWGRLVADVDGLWLDLARVIMLEGIEGSRPRSPQSVRLSGADFDAARAAATPDNLAPWRVTVTGVWLGDAIKVWSQSLSAPAPVWAAREWTTPPCPPPADGWPHGDRDQNLDFDRLGLQDSGAAVTIVTFRPSRYQAVLVVAAEDIDVVEAVLRPQLGDQLCVVPSKWTRQQLDDVRAHLVDHWQDWTVETISEDIDEQAQACVEVGLLRVTSDLADWAETLSDDLLRLVPSLTPIESL